MPLERGAAVLIQGKQQNSSGEYAHFWDMQTIVFKLMLFLLSTERDGSVSSYSVWEGCPQFFWHLEAE